MSIALDAGELPRRIGVSGWSHAGKMLDSLRRLGHSFCATERSGAGLPRCASACYSRPCACACSTSTASTTAHSPACSGWHPLMGCRACSRLRMRRAQLQTCSACSSPRGSAADSFKTWTSSSRRATAVSWAPTTCGAWRCSSAHSSRRSWSRQCAPSISSSPCARSHAASSLAACRARGIVPGHIASVAGRARAPSSVRACRRGTPNLRRQPHLPLYLVPLPSLPTPRAQARRRRVQLAAHATGPRGRLGGQLWLPPHRRQLARAVLEPRGLGAAPFPAHREAAAR